MMVMLLYMYIACFIRQHSSAVYVGMVHGGCLYNYAVLQTKGTTTPEQK